MKRSAIVPTILVRVLHEYHLKYQSGYYIQNKKKLFIFFFISLFGEMFYVCIFIT